MDGGRNEQSSSLVSCCQSQPGSRLLAVMQIDKMTLQDGKGVPSASASVTSAASAQHR